MKTNYEFGKVIDLNGQIEADDAKVVSHVIFETSNGGVLLLALIAGQKLDKHLAPAELMVNVLEGEIEFTMDENVHSMRKGEFILVGADVPHSVVAKSDAKLMLVRIKN